MMRLRKIRIVLALGVLTLTGCSAMPWAKSAFDEWRSLCGRSLAARVEVQSEARTRRIDVDDFADALCELSDVVAPFMQAAEVRKAPDPSEQAVAAARRLGVLP